MQEAQTPRFGSWGDLLEAAPLLFWETRRWGDEILYYVADPNYVAAGDAALLRPVDIVSVSQYESAGEFKPDLLDLAVALDGTALLHRDGTGLRFRKTHAGVIAEILDSIPVYAPGENIRLRTFVGNPGPDREIGVRIGFAILPTDSWASGEISGTDVRDLTEAEKSKAIAARLTRQLKILDCVGPCEKWDTFLFYECPARSFAIALPANTYCLADFVYRSTSFQLNSEICAGGCFAGSPRGGAREAPPRRTRRSGRARR